MPASKSPTGKERAPPACLLHLGRPNLNQASDQARKDRQAGAKQGKLNEPAWHGGAGFVNRLICSSSVLCEGLPAAVDTFPFRAAPAPSARPSHRATQPSQFLQGHPPLKPALQLPAGLADLGCAVAARRMPARLPCVPAAALAPPRRRRLLHAMGRPCVHVLLLHSRAPLWRAGRRLWQGWPA